MVRDVRCRAYLVISATLMITLVVGVIAGFEFLRSLYETAALINTVIVGAFFIGLVAVARYLFLVTRELTLFDEFADWCDRPDQVSFDFERMHKSIMGSVLGAVSCSIQEHGILVLGSSSDGRSIVEGLEKGFASRLHLVNFVSGFLVLLGLMGTFFGLTLTLKSMGEILSTLAGGLSDASDASILQVMIELIVQLKNPMTGMGTAFSTSLFGLSGSAFIGLFALILRRMHDQLKKRLEVWLNEKTEVGARSVGATGSAGLPVAGDMGGQLAAMSELLAKNNEAVMEALDNSNKYLLKMILLQQRSVEAMSVVMEQSTETARNIGLGNELAGRLIKESRQIAATLERNIGLKGRGE